MMLAEMDCHNEIKDRKGNDSGDEQLFYHRRSRDECPEIKKEKLHAHLIKNYSKSMHPPEIDSTCSICPS